MRTFVCLIFLVCASSISSANDDKHKDRVLLKTGGEIYGTVIADDIKGEDGNTYLVIESESGGTIKLDKNRLVKRGGVIYGAQLAEYDALAKAANTPDSHRLAIQWCKDQKKGSIQFKNEIAFHWRQILKMNPADKDARRALGYDYDRIKGMWVKTEINNAASGYVKKGSKWFTEQAIRLQEKLEADEAAQNASKIAFGKWAKKVGKVDQGTLINHLHSITGPTTIGHMFAYAKNQKNAKLRLLLIDAIGDVPGGFAAQYLTYFAIRDDDPTIRERATTLLQQKHYDPSVVVSNIISNGLLSDKSNVIIENTGMLLGQLDTQRGIVPLISALQTKHKVATGQQPGSLNTTSQNGQVGGLNTGGPKEVEMTFKNERVLGALRTLTGAKVDFGFDRNAWMQWYVENYAYTEMDLRREDD